MKRKIITRGLAFLMAFAVLFGALPPVLARAELIDISDNEIIISKTVPKGKTGKRMTVNFTVRNNTEEDWQDVEVNIYNGSSYIASPSAEGEYIFPFEVTEGTFEPKHVGTVKKHSSRSVSLPAMVRADLPEGYYAVQIEVSSRDNKATTTEYLNIWITKPTGDDEEEEDDKEVGFVMGEGQPTPRGSYPEAMNFTINMRNNGLSEARDVSVVMVLDKDSTVFPFDINEGNYDRNFEKIEPGQVVELPYSMGIRSETYTGYYPIKFEIRYRETATGQIMKEEESFWVHVRNKEKEDNSGEFNENDRTKARIVVDSFETIPETIIAGEPFRLILRMKNASASIAASNILFTLESEKVDNSSVFTTESGSSSVVVNSLGAGEVTELSVDMLSRAGIDQRSYALTIKETYDSPEFKNASESVTIDIPVRQIARLNTGTMEVMPDSVTVGSESNIMFPINNTGKVILYNVMVAFEADSIQPTDTYVGNIKPGETGNVDVMLSAIAPTMDEGKIKVRITYEDESGEVQPEVEKELSLYVVEAMEEDPGLDMEVGGMMEMPVEEDSFFERYKLWIGAGAAAAAVAVFVIVRRRKKKKAQQEEDDLGDEIS
ncbi:MAG: hypothetical protein HFG78_02435 [Hungatella sp.]|jgi:hypothetical protein|nr:hypothetical protein [Hungatella sp.]MCI9501155.1 hypothetical protein [Hungatella sp.]MCI9635914.1 hypothetical protein [Hungatella sp.]